MMPERRAAASHAASLQQLQRAPSDAGSAAL